MMSRDAGGSRAKTVELEDAVVVITGASSGIGEAAAEAFAREGPLSWPRAVLRRSTRWRRDAVLWA